MKSYFRFLSRNKLYTAIEVAGLSIALAFVVIFTCYVRQQLDVCYFYRDYDKIYLVGLGNETYSCHNMAHKLKDEVPEMEDAVLVQQYYNGYKINGEISSKESLLVVGKDFFNFFPIVFLKGSPDEFNTKDNAFVTESFAKRNGGDKVIGQKLVDGDKEFVIAGIIEDFTAGVFPNFEIVVNANSNYYKEEANYISSALMTFVKVGEDANIDELQVKVRSLVSKWYKSFNVSQTDEASLVRLDKLYFSDLKNGGGLKSEDPNKLLVFSIVVIFILASAVINYVNLNVANAQKRAKEMSIRHIMGEEYRKIGIRIFVESLITVALSFSIAMGIALLIMEDVNWLLQSVVLTKLSFTLDYIVLYLLLMIAIAALCTIFVYVALKRVKFTSSTNTGRRMGRVFICLQFILSFIMISSAVTMELQMKHILSRDMNANMDNIYFTNSISQQLKQELEVLPFVRSIGVTTAYPGYFPFSIRKNGDPFSISIMECDSVAFRIFGFKKIQDFNKGDCLGTWMSESAANKYNITAENPVWVANPGVNAISHIVPGIIKDIPTREILNSNNEALAMVSVISAQDLRWGGFVLEVEHTEENRHLLDSLVQTVYLKRYGMEATGYGFLRVLQKDKYDKTIRDMRLMEMFMVIAIMLSTLAFLAMSMHYATGNTKQVAIHKVFGGSTRSETVRCMAQYFKIMAVAIVLSLPVAVWISSRYLEQFAEKIALEENWWIFVAAAIILILISTATVLLYTIRAARANPVEVLKKE